MATTQAPVPDTERRSGSRIGLTRLAATIAAAAGLIFVLCWLGTFLTFSSPTHAFIGLFTNAEPQSVNALVEGATWSVLFGLLSGGIVAALYNLFAGLDRR
jgi:hypothetical protein